MENNIGILKRYRCEENSVQAIFKYPVSIIPIYYATQVDSEIDILQNAILKFFYIGIKNSEIIAQKLGIGEEYVRVIDDEIYKLINNGKVDFERNITDDELNDKIADLLMDFDAEKRLIEEKYSRGYLIFDGVRRRLFPVILKKIYRTSIDYIKQKCISHSSEYEVFDDIERVHEVPEKAYIFTQLKELVEKNNESIVEIGEDEEGGEGAEETSISDREFISDVQIVDNEIIHNEWMFIRADAFIDPVKADNTITIKTFSPFTGKENSSFANIINSIKNEELQKKIQKILYKHCINMEEMIFKSSDEVKTKNYLIKENIKKRLKVQLSPEVFGDLIQAESELYIYQNKINTNRKNPINNWYMVSEKILRLLVDSIKDISIDGAIIKTIRSYYSVETIFGRYNSVMICNEIKKNIYNKAQFVQDKNYTKLNRFFQKGIRDSLGILFLAIINTYSKDIDEVKELEQLVSKDDNIVIYLDNIAEVRNSTSAHSADVLVNMSEGEYINMLNTIVDQTYYVLNRISPILNITHRQN